MSQLYDKGESLQFSLSQRSLKNLTDIHPDLVLVVREAIRITKVDFVVIEGRRSRERQHALVAAGASKTLNSRHITGHAVDIVPLIDGQVSWRWKDFTPVVAAMRKAAREWNIPVDHGYDWKKFPDAPHHELSRSHYPDQPTGEPDGRTA